MSLEYFSLVEPQFVWVRGVLSFLLSFGVSFSLTIDRLSLRVVFLPVVSEFEILYRVLFLYFSILMTLHVLFAFTDPTTDCRVIYNDLEVTLTCILM